MAEPTQESNYLRISTTASPNNQVEFARTEVTQVITVHMVGNESDTSPEAEDRRATSMNQSESFEAQAITKELYNKHLIEAVDATTEEVQYTTITPDELDVDQTTTAFGSQQAAMQCPMSTVDVRHFRKSSSFARFINAVRTVVGLDGTSEEEISQETQQLVSASLIFYLVTSNEEIAIKINRDAFSNLSVEIQPARDWACIRAVLDVADETRTFAFNIDELACMDCVSCAKAKHYSVSPLDEFRYSVRLTVSQWTYLRHGASNIVCKCYSYFEVRSVSSKICKHNNWVRTGLLSSHTAQS